MDDLAQGDWGRLAERLEWEMHRKGHKQASLEAAMGPNGPKIRSIRNALKRNAEPRSEIPPTHRRMAAFFGWAPGSIEAVLAGGEPIYMATSEPPEPRPMARAVKDEWRRRVEDSDMSPAAKRETLELIDSIPDAD